MAQHLLRHFYVTIDKPNAVFFENFLAIAAFFSPASHSPLFSSTQDPGGRSSAKISKEKPYPSAFQGDVHK